MTVIGLGDQYRNVDWVAEWKQRSFASLQGLQFLESGLRFPRLYEKKEEDKESMVQETAILSMTEQSS